MNATNPYASPLDVSVRQGAPIPGDEVLCVPRRSCMLPKRCVVCNQPPLDKAMPFMLPAMRQSRMRAMFFWGFLLTFVWFVLAIWPRIKIITFLCESHFRDEQRARLVFQVSRGIGVILFIAGFAMGFAGQPLYGVLTMPIGMMLFFLAICFQLFRHKPLYVVEVDKESLWLAGADSQFIAQANAGL